MIDVGDTVKVYGTDQHGRQIDGMTGVITRIGAIYAHVAISMWSLEEVMVPRFDVRLHDPTPMSVAEWKTIHNSWQRRNARVIKRMRRRCQEAA